MGTEPVRSCRRPLVSICDGTGQEECQDTQVDSLTQVPEEVCDLQPQKSCKPITRLVPSLRPTQECGRVPREICTLQPGQQRLVKRPLVTEWCLDEDSDEDLPL